MSMYFKEGRQGTGYKTLTLFKSKLLKCDAYIIVYPTYSSIPAHKDPAPVGYIHNRINLVLPTKHIGGHYIEHNPTTNKEYACKECRFLGFKLTRIYPSEIVHSVTKIIKGRRIVLSFGWLSKKK